jgi:hypothetical protein
MLRSIKYKDITEKVSNNINVNQDIIDSIVLDTFFDLKERMSKFEDLRYSLKGLMTFYYRKTKLEKLLDLVDKLINGELVLKHDTFNSFPYDRDPHELRNKILRLLGRYEKYIETKNETRANNKRYKESIENNLEKYKGFFTGEHQDAI